jgi:hypothetical protein
VHRLAGVHPVAAGGDDVQRPAGQAEVAGGAGQRHEGVQAAPQALLGRRVLRARRRVVRRPEVHDPLGEPVAARQFTQRRQGVVR